MAISDYKITAEDIAKYGCVSLPDTLTGDAQENKAKFDRLVRECVANSIGIEMCSVIRNGVYVIPEETMKRGVKLTRELMAKYHVPVSRVCRHYDVTHKNCPEPWVRNPQLWQKFKTMLTEKEVEDMTEAQTRAIAKQEISKAESAKKVYNSVAECPAWAKDTVQKLVNKGFLQGDDQGKLALTTDLLRLLVINDRAHLYG